MAISTQTTTTKPNADTVIPRGNYRGKHTGKSYEPKNHWVVCDVCGFDIRARDIRMTWDNRAVCPSDWEPRHPQDFVRSKYDHIRADDPVRPPPEDTFIELAPNGSGDNSDGDDDFGNFLTLSVGSTGTNLNFVANLTWTEVLNENVTSYNVYRDDVLIASPGNVLMYDDATGAIGTFTYHVTALNSAGESRPSNSVTVDNPLVVVLQGWNPNDITANTGIRDEGEGVEISSFGKIGGVRSIVGHSTSGKYQCHFSIAAVPDNDFPLNTFYCIADKPNTPLRQPRPWDSDSGQNVVGVGDNSLGASLNNFRGLFYGDPSFNFDIVVRFGATDIIDFLVDFDEGEFTVLRNGTPIGPEDDPETPIGPIPFPTETDDDIPVPIEYFAFARMQVYAPAGPNRITNDFDASDFTPEEGFVPWDAT